MLGSQSVATARRRPEEWSPRAFFNDRSVSHRRFQTRSRSVSMFMAAVGLIGQLEAVPACNGP